MMSKKINEFQNGEQIQCFCLIKSADARKTRAGKPYLALTFTDQSGDISGMLWDADDNAINQFVAGKVIFLDGLRSEYNSRPQVRINSLRLATDAEPNDPAIYTAHAPMSRAKMQEELDSYIFAITNGVWARIVRELMQRHASGFFTWPAATRNHHAYAGGLAFHTLSILRLAKAVCDLYDGINKSLLYAGAICHDLGKLTELSGPVGTQYTTEGKLLGHISIMDGEIVSVCNDLKIDPNDSDVVLLRHMVLSHHGKLEFGSPERPALLEAEILNRLDDLDASITEVQGALKKTAPGEFTNRLFAMDNRAFFRPDASGSTNQPDNH